MLPRKLRAQLPARIPRHSLAARLFHWIMAASMFTLLFTAFLPKVGVQFDWVTYHWIAGTVLTISIIFHIIHASFYLDFWSIWPDRADLEDAWKRFQRFMGKSSALPRKFAKYPLENKLYHGAIIVTGMSVILTGVFMMSRVRTIFFPRNPYLFSDMTWGLMYVLHGLAGVGLITLVIVHVYFAIRPEKLPITASMIVGTMSREFYLKEHDPETLGGRDFRLHPPADGEADGALDSRIAVMRSKSATSSCWPMRGRACPVMKAASRADRSANFCSAPSAR